MKKNSSIQKDFTKIFKAKKLGFQHIESVHKNAELIVSSFDGKGNILNKKVVNITKYKGFSLNLWINNLIINNIDVFQDDIEKIVIFFKVDVFYQYGEGDLKIKPILGHNILDAYQNNMNLESLISNGKIIGFQAGGVLVELTKD